MLRPVWRMLVPTSTPLISFSVSMPSAWSTASTAAAAELARAGRIQLELEPGLDVVGADDLIVHAGDPAARDGQPLAHLRVLLLQFGDSRRGEREGVAIVEGDSGRRGRRDVRARRGAALLRARRERRRCGRVARGGLAHHLRGGLAALRIAALAALGAAAAGSGGGEKQNKEGNRTTHDHSPLIVILSHESTRSVDNGKSPLASPNPGC